MTFRLHLHSNTTEKETHHFKNDTLCNYLNATLVLIIVCLLYF